MGETNNEKYLQNNRGALLNPRAAAYDEKFDPLSKAPVIATLKGDGWSAMMIARRPRSTDQEPEIGPHIGLSLQSNGNGVWDRYKMSFVKFPLTSLTTEELDALEDFIRKVIANARFVVARRDLEAKEAAERGDDTFARAYRVLPQLVHRSRYVTKHLDILWHNLAAGTGLYGGDESEAGGLHRGGTDVADSDEADHGSDEHKG